MLRFLLLSILFSYSDKKRKNAQKKWKEANGHE